MKYRPFNQPCPMNRIGCRAIGSMGVKRLSILTVGPTGQFKTLASAVAASHDGDVLQVQAGTYTNDFTNITTKITIEGVGGMVNLVATVPPPNGKAIMVTNTDVTLKDIAFSGAAVASGNGAGIRFQGGNLTIVDCYFHNNQEGLLAGAYPTGNITITNSEFAYNGTGTGYTHNLYVGDINTLTITGSYFHNAVVGHEIKSLAQNTIIENNRIADGPTGTASYAIDLPAGGKVVIANNIIEKGPHAQNPSFIHMGSSAYPGSSLLISNNVFVNDLNRSSVTLLYNQTAVTADITNNQIYHVPHIASGPATASGTVVLTTEPTISTAHPYLVSPTSTVGGTIAVSNTVPKSGPRFIASPNGQTPVQPQTVALSKASAVDFVKDGYGGTGASSLAAYGTNIGGGASGTVLPQPNTVAAYATDPNVKGHPVLAAIVPHT
jgi:hypothetical protein